MYIYLVQAFFSTYDNENWEKASVRGTALEKVLKHKIGSMGQGDNWCWDLTCVPCTVLSCQVSKEAIKHSDWTIRGTNWAGRRLREQKKKAWGDREQETGLSMKLTLERLFDYLELNLVCCWRGRRSWRSRSSNYSAWNNTRGHSNASPIMKNCRQLSSTIHNENI